MDCELNIIRGRCVHSTNPTGTAAKISPAAQKGIDAAPGLIYTIVVYHTCDSTFFAVWGDENR